jgi:hypothetical protein
VSSAVRCVALAKLRLAQQVKLSGGGVLFFPLPHTPPGTVLETSRFSNGDSWAGVLGNHHHVKYRNLP